ncbi:energy transducer TonB [Qipengyuania sp. 1NDH17]|uniref:Energy transducer TonB n=1 Tax=Qipengyuania polymorpha TaxID=2867234 RepID=A0ABS7IXJ2_9SPHN|nr:energy transducer TonB [Qipengyuania polymorpha]MBX7457739.1 energy transducer TonB [Qipengyuania polymorpha]
MLNFLRTAVQLVIMILSLASAMIAALTAASGPQLPDDLSRNVDYPLWALRAEASVFVIFELRVDPRGRVYECTVLDSVGSERLAREI